MRRAVARVFAGLLFVVLLPVGLEDPASACTTLEADTLSGAHPLVELNVEQTDPDIIDVLEVEDDEASENVAVAHATTARASSTGAGGTPPIVHLKDPERPPRG